MARVPLESLLEEYEYAKHLKNPFGAEADSFRRRLQTGAQAQWSLTTLQGLAFWNHACGARSQPWTAFEAQAELQALRADVEKGLVPVLEVLRDQVQFAHLSYQESRKGKGCSDQGPAETMDGQPLLGQLHAIKRPPARAPPE